MEQAILAPQDFDPKRIATYDFTDLYISERGELTIKGLAQDQTEESDGKAWLSTEVPKEIEDTEELKAALYEADDNRTKNKEDVSFTFDYDGTRFRVSVIESTNGKWYTLRKINPPKRLKEFKGLHPLLRRSLLYLGSNGSAKNAQAPLSGLILINGPTGSGKTTLAGALLQEYLINYGGVAVTIEDPPEINFPETYLNGKGRVFQTEVMNGDFATGCQNSMRYAPRYILLGEVRDRKAADQAIRAAINGHLVITTIHAGSIEEAIDTLNRLADAGSSHILAQGLRAVLDVRLLNMPGGQRKFMANSLLIPPTHEGRAISNHVSRNRSEMLGTFIEQQENLMKRKIQPVEWYETGKKKDEEKKED